MRRIMGVTRSGWRLLFVFAWVWLPACGHRGTIPATSSDAMSIAEARAAPVGAEVNIHGIVTVPSGLFRSSLPRGFAIQDATAGVYVIDSVHHFQTGEALSVRGIRGTEHAEDTVSLEEVEVLPSREPVAPQPIRTGGVDAKLGGRLVRLEGSVVGHRDDEPYGYKLFVDDGSGACQVYVNASTGMVDRARRLEVGSVAQVVGFLGRYEERFEVLPRTPDDLVEAPVPVAE